MGPMSRLEKLSISGIRSFSPAESNAIVFNSPLTLIVGENGTGKTAVIESLKYATTGNFPPNTKGGAFVCDPAMVDQIDVKAEIKLRFISNANELLSCLRVLQVFQRGGRQIQKTLESSLHREAPGERTLMSAKLAEIDQAIPGHLGVSQPLLDSVIFCHHEESTWPISEPRILKERLDQILDSSKYNKALKGLREAKKSIGSDIRLKMQSLEFLLKEKDKKEQIQRDIQALEETVEGKGGSLQSLAGERRRIEQNLQVLKKDIEIHQKIDANLRIIKAEFDNCKSYIRSFGHAVLEDARVEALLPGARSSCGLVLEQYKRHLCARLAELEPRSSSLSVESFEDDYYRMEKAAERFMEHAKKTQSLQSTIGVLRSRLAEKEDERAALLETLHAEFGSSGGDIHDGAARVFARLEAEIGTERIVLQDRREALLLKREQRGDLLRALDGIRALGEQEIDPSVDLHEAAEVDYDGLVNLEAELYELEEKQTEYQAQLKRAYKNTELAFRHAQLEKELVELQEACSRIDVEDLEGRIESLEAERRAAEKELRTYQDEAQRMRLNIAERQSALSRMADEYGIVAKKHAFLSENGCEGMKEALAVQALQLVHSVGWPADGPRLSKRAVIQHIICAAWDRVAGLLAIPEEALAAAELKPVAALAKEIEDCRNLQKVTSNASAIYKNFLGVVRQRSQCPLCKTALCPDSLAQFASRLERVILRLPEELAGAQQKEEALMAALRCADAENAETERQNAAKMEAKWLRSGAEKLIVADAVEKFRYLARKLAFYPGRFGGASAIPGDILHVLNDSAASEFVRACESSIAAIYKSCFECRAEIECRAGMEAKLTRLRAEAEMAPAGEAAVDGVSRAVDAVGVEIEEKKKEYSRLKVAIQQGEALKAKADMARAVLAARTKTAELEGKIRELGDVAELEASLKAAESRAASAYDAYIKHKARAEVGLDGHSSLCKQIAQLERDLSRHREEVESLSTASGTEMLAERIEGEASPAKIEKYMLEMREALLKRKDEYIEAIKQATERCKVEIANVEENIKLRRAKERMLAIQGEIGTYDSRKLEQLRERAAQYEERRANVASAEVSLKGELKQLNISLAGHRNDLSRNYAEVGKAYSKCVVHLRALELAASDVDRCVSALDHAIAEFHAAKIDEVNTVLRDLWTGTYRGNDIEYIELKAEVSDSKAYSYSIVMVKNGARMEMRGRCCAGQKMIASILIRLAMADSFSSNCNILALDEPTTNLDRANVESLAVTLALLIRERSDVQLIVISHDEEFIELLSREGVDYFYRLKRDARGNSHIEKHSVYAS